MTIYGYQSLNGWSGADIRIIARAADGLVRNADVTLHTESADMKGMPSRTFAMQ
jgi:hypothetical protein